MRLNLRPKVLNFAINVKLSISEAPEKYKNAEFIYRKVFLAL